jgi:hypothetical protein
MDFTQVNLFGKKTFADLLKEIHTNQKDKEVQLRSLIEGTKTPYYFTRRSYYYGSFNQGIYGISN